MKKFFLAMLVILFLAGCSSDFETKTTVKRVGYLKSYPSMVEVLIFEVDEGSLLVWSPKEELKKFLSQVKPGDQIILEAGEAKSSDNFFSAYIVRSRFYTITGIVRLPDGARYKRKR